MNYQKYDKVFLILPMQRNRQSRGQGQNTSAQDLLTDQRYMNDKDPSLLCREDLERATETLRSGGLILYPTDTIWGIGCDATNEEAVRRIYDLKRRADAKSMLVLVADDWQIDALVDTPPEIAFDMMDMAIRPITIIFSGARGVAPSLLAEDGSLGIRRSREAFSQALCRRMRRPIVSTSANLSGDPTPMTFDAICEEIKQGVDYIVRYRQEDKSVAEPSQIIKLGPGAEVKVIRP